MTIVAKNQRILPENNKLAELTKANLDELKQVFETWDDGRGGLSRAPQGYTYIGQFIAHEIFPRPGVNQRTWKIDLDSVYPSFFDNSKIDPSNGHFRITAANSEFCDDLLRDPQSRKANIPEFRNDDQLLIAQIHLGIQLFHNKVIDIISDSRVGHFSKDTLFAMTQEYVRASFQCAIMDDFLKELCCDHVYKALWLDGKPTIIEIGDREHGLPFEISHAVARFGHSMVRNFYTLNLKHREAMDVPLRRLFELTGENNPAFDGVPNNLKPDWNLFFNDECSNQAKSARHLDPIIVDQMLQPPNPDLILTNLNAGIRRKVASGQQLAKRIIEELDWKQIAGGKAGDHLGIREELRVVKANEDQKERLENIGLWKHTPLWLYILMEADSPDTHGLTLGPLGSLLVIETLKNTIRIPGIRFYKDVQNEFETLIPQLSCARVSRIIKLFNH